MSGDEKHSGAAYSVVMRGLDPRIHHRAKKIDRRVKLGDDGRVCNSI
jgi:hypothetical protein